MIIFVLKICSWKKYGKNVTFGKLPETRPYENPKFLMTQGLENNWLWYKINQIHEYLQNLSEHSQNYDNFVTIVNSGNEKLTRES